jgi:hypothetical protein
MTQYSPEHPLQLKQLHFFYRLLRTTHRAEAEHFLSTQPWFNQSTNWIWNTYVDKKNYSHLHQSHTHRIPTYKHDSHVLQGTDYQRIVLHDVLTSRAHTRQRRLLSGVVGGSVKRLYYSTYIILLLQLFITIHTAMYSWTLYLPSHVWV